MKLRQRGAGRLRSKSVTVLAAGMSLVWLAAVGFATTDAPQLPTRSAMSIADSDKVAGPILAMSRSVPALGGGQAAQAAAGDKQMLAGEVFKNVQALKEMPVADFMTSMGLMCASVAADCADC